jgi:hypothetical protein
MWIHILLTLFFTIYIAAFACTVADTNESSWGTFVRIRDTDGIISIFILMFLIGQLIFLFNIVAGLIKNRRYIVPHD